MKSFNSASNIDRRIWNIKDENNRKKKKKIDSNKEENEVENVLVEKKSCKWGLQVKDYTSFYQVELLKL